MERFSVSYFCIRNLYTISYSTIVLFIEIYFRLPTWANKIVYPGNDFEKLATLYYTSATYTKHLARFRAGFLLRSIFNRFSLKINSTLTPDYSLSLYSGHGNLIVNVLNALNVFQVNCIFSFIFKMLIH